MSRRPLPRRVRALLPAVSPLESRRMFDTTYYNLAAGPLQQNWNDTNVITTNNDWSTVPSITGFRGDRVNNNTGADPRTLTDDSTPATGNPVNVTANVTDPTAPTTNTSGGLYEFENPNSTNDPTVGMQGSGTADAPYLKIYLNTTGQTSVPVSYNLRDLDTTDTAVQQFVAQYRVGTTGDYTNIPLSYVADASADGTATLVTPVSFNLPSDALGKAQVELRILTADAFGADAMVGVDDIVVGGQAANTYNFDPSTYTVNEGAGTVTLSVTRGNTSAAATVAYATASGSAVAGSDFTNTTGTLSFAAGVATQTFTVPILNDNVAESLESFTVTLSSPSAGTLGNSPTATVTIADNDSVAPTGLLLNEVSANPPGTDNPNEYIEVRGTAGQRLLNVYALSVEGDATANAGAVTGVYDLSGGTVGTNGLLIVKSGSSTFTIDPATGVVNNASFDTAGGTLQNGANSFLIVYSPNAVPTGDLDVNNDGTIDNLPTGATILDGAGYITTNATAPGIAYGAILPQLTTTTITDDVPDAITRVAGNNTPLSSSAFYGGDLEGADNTSLAYITTDNTRLTPNTPAGAVLTPGAANFGSTADTTPPTVTASAFVFDVSAMPMSATITFSENVQASLTASDVQLVNLTTGATVPTANITISGYNTTTNVATIRFPGYTNGVLPNGNYRLTLPAGSVSDAAGNNLATAATLNFFTLAGDANRDRKVDFNDFLLLQNNFNQSGKSFSVGDFNYTGTVDFNDFLILQNNFGATLPAPAVTATKAAVKTATKSYAVTGTAAAAIKKDRKHVFA